MKARIKAEFHEPVGLTELEFSVPSIASGRRRISRDALPPGVVAQVERVLGPDAAVFDWRSIKGGTIGEEGNFEVEGTSGEWKWEVELTESGRLLEVEKERRRR